MIDPPFEETGGRRVVRAAGNFCESPEYLDEFRFLQAHASDAAGKPGDFPMCVFQICFVVVESHSVSLAVLCPHDHWTVNQQVTLASIRPLWFMGMTDNSGFVRV